MLQGSRKDIQLKSRSPETALWMSCSLKVRDRRERYNGRYREVPKLPLGNTVPALHASGRTKQDVGKTLVPRKPSLFTADGTIHISEDFRVAVLSQPSMKSSVDSILKTEVEVM